MFNACLTAVNEDISVFDCTYMFPKSLPQGQYHFRVNVSNASVSALSDTFEVTAPQFNCLHPPTWTNITSTSDPNYRSLVLTSPQAGDVQSIGINKGGEIDVSWAYRVDVTLFFRQSYALTYVQDARNAVNANISQLTFEYVNDKTGEATGSSTPTLEDTVSTIFAFSGTDLSPGAWRIRANYTNTFEKGSPVSYLSEIFYIDGADGNCEGLATSSIGGKGSNGGAGRFKGLEALWPSVMLVAFPFLSLWQFY